MLVLTVIYKYITECRGHSHREMHEQGNEYLILPLEFSPHLAEFNLSTHCRHDVVHDVNMNVT